MARAMSFAQALVALKSGDRAFVTLPDPRKPEQRMSVATVGGQRKISLAAWSKLAPLVDPVGDGLLPETSQTFALKPEAAQ